MRLGEGELTMHYRRYSKSVRTKIECGVTHGCITSYLADVTCEHCKKIAEMAQLLAATCGCRESATHAPVARAQYEIAGHLS